MKAIFLAGVALAAIVASPTLAADMERPAPAPVYKEPPPPVIVTWTGFYVGANAGYSWGSSRVDYAIPSSSFAVQESFDLRGATAGGQIGYNYQTGIFVWGVEADFNWRDAKADGSCFLTGTTGCSSGTALTTFQTEQSWFGTVRGRVGVAAGGSFLLYGTGGIAFGELKHQYTEDKTNVAGAVRTAAESDTHVGWTAGGGGEVMLGSQWSLGVEYLHMDFGSKTLSLPDEIIANVHFHPSSTTFKDHSEVVRGKLNFRWGG
jgi:outer membrane immunogenic protein